jgi:hypothetical protein
MNNEAGEEQSQKQERVRHEPRVWVRPLSTEKNVYCGIVERLHLLKGAGTRFFTQKHWTAEI